ncbi:S8 family serine peptidase [Streptomyces sp. NPDC014636]|uniref:S8 family serine peptidase n=1 Tax=Streptomyces sp. NPDC014636 TaxID=3364876 RepID=UPI0036F6F2CF
MSQMVDALSAQYGTLFVIAAGNAGPESISAPGAAASALTVAATDKEDRLASFSSTGPLASSGGVKPDIAAPGVDITAARSQEMTDGGAGHDGTSATVEQAQRVACRSLPPGHAPHAPWPACPRAPVQYVLSDVIDVVPERAADCGGRRSRMGRRPTTGCPGDGPRAPGPPHPSVHPLPLRVCTVHHLTSARQVAAVQLDVPGRRS